MICILESRDAYSVTVEDGFHLYQSQTDEHCFSIKNCLLPEHPHLKLKMAV